MAYKKIGVAGPVGSGKTALIEAVTREMASSYSISLPFYLKISYQLYGQPPLRLQ